MIKGPKFIKCSKCNSEVISQGFKKHFNSCTGIGILNKRRYTGKGQDWIKNKRYDDVYGIEGSREKRLKTSLKLEGFKHTEKTCQKLSNTLKGKTGGIRKGGGRGKNGWYNGYWCDSSWELAWVIYQLEHNILFNRNKDGFEYIFEGKKHKYYPDFILEDGTFIEIKGYWTKQFIEKLKSFPHNLKILDKKDIQFYLNYVQKKYGNDFIKMYIPT
jgi:hypothetical protein